MRIRGRDAGRRSYCGVHDLHQRHSCYRPLIWLYAEKPVAWQVSAQASKEPTTSSYHTVELLAPPRPRNKNGSILLETYMVATRTVDAISTPEDPLNVFQPSAMLIRCSEIGLHTVRRAAWGLRGLMRKIPMILLGELQIKRDSCSKSRQQQK